MIKLFFAFAFYFFAANVYSQNTTGTTFFNNISKEGFGKGSLTIVQDPGIAKLVGIHIDASSKNKLIDGFRIQLYLGSNNNAKKEAAQVKSRLLSLFPNERPHVIYEAPFWRVQVGDFRSKNEALSLYKKLKPEFPSCYAVPVNNIPLSSLR